MPEFAKDEHFSRLIQGQFDHVDLATVALEIARDEYPGLDIADWRGRLTQMGSRLHTGATRLGAIESLINQINRLLFVDEGFKGNNQEYYDPRNSFLNDVIGRKLGIPITLSLVYLAVAEGAGLRLFGVGMPTHFIVKYQADGWEVFIDPFHDGAILTRELCELRVSNVIGMPVTLSRDQLAPSAHDQVVLRLLGNLKGIYTKLEDSVRGLRVQERICALNKLDPHEVRDLGVLYLKNDRPARAIEVFENYLKMKPKADDFEDIESMIRGAKRIQISMN